MCINIHAHIQTHTYTCMYVYYRYHRKSHKIELLPRGLRTNRHTYTHVYAFTHTLTPVVLKATLFPDRVEYLSGYFIRVFYFENSIFLILYWKFDIFLAKIVMRGTPFQNRETCMLIIFKFWPLFCTDCDERDAVSE